MKFPVLEDALGWAACRFFCALALLAICNARGDQVEMSNGDRYVGRVVSLSGDTLVLRSEVLGNLRLPRSRISSILLGPQRTTPALGSNVTRFTLSAPRSEVGSSTNRFQASSPASTNAASEFSAAMQQLGANTNIARQVQDQFLAGAGPEAQAKFNDLMGGLLSGKVDLAGLRAEAKSTLEQAKKMRGGLGEEGGGMMDSYLTILDSFLKETEPQTAGTNTPTVNPAQSLPQKPAPNAPNE